MNMSIRRLLESARRHGFLKTLVTIVPIAAMTSAVSTVTICLCVWRSGPSYMPGLMFPAVSELGVEGPQKLVYQVGFGTCGALLSFAIMMYGELVGPKLLVSNAAAGQDGGQGTDHLKPGSHVRLTGLKGAAELNGQFGVCRDYDKASGRWTVDLCLGSSKAVLGENLVDVTQKQKTLDTVIWWGHVAAAGVASQGIFTLEHSISSRCFIHWGGAIFFLLGAQQHGKASNELYDQLTKEGLALVKSRSVSAALLIRHFILDYSSMALFMVPLLMQFFPALGSDGAGAKNTTGTMVATKNASGSKEPPFDPKMMNIMGIMQWGIILQFAVFFCTYTADLRVGADIEAKDKNS